jgi:hypothetical protein
VAKVPSFKVLEVNSASMFLFYFFYDKYCGEILRENSATNWFKNLFVNGGFLVDVLRVFYLEIIYSFVYLFLEFSISSTFIFADLFVTTLCLCVTHTQIDRYYGPS